jgi:Na+-transporting NADH:ubiquinone oxidoreductase subunit B
MAEEVMNMRLKGLFQKQQIMRTVLLSLIPVALGSVYLFGWRVLTLLAVSVLAACVAEYLVARTIQKDKTRITEAALVSAALFTLTLPPETPYWIAVVGIVFGIVFGKMVYGGFGRNFFNPALVGRCFIYIAFPTQMTMQWAQPFTGLPGGFARFMPLSSPDALSSATPLMTFENTGEMMGLDRLALGTIPGSLGETSAVLILLCALFLVFRKVASWQIMVSTVGAAGLLSAVLYYTGASTLPPLFALLTGGLFFGSVFMATDPVSAPKRKGVQWVFGALVGAITIIIRVYGLFTEGMMFAILIANALTPLLELKAKDWADKRKAAVKGAAA